ncbi:MAG: TetR/AcrR family transcriptional regulator, partial [Methylococcaceae bacterium]|nr:TetR/AcrR family transcriptional regulator [Methylococcaceae bacterium]
MPQKNDTRVKLIESALDLIYERSYVDVGIQSLCERAGVKKGNFYYYFDSKQDLLVQALDFRAQALKTILAPVFDKNVPASKRIEALFEKIYLDQKAYQEETGHVRGCFFGNLALELSTQDERIRQRVENILKGLVKLVEETLQELVDTGELEEIDTASSAQAVVAFLEGVILFAKLRNDPGLILSLAKTA